MTYCMGFGCLCQKRGTCLAYTRWRQLENRSAAEEVINGQQCMKNGYPLYEETAVIIKSKKTLKVS